MLEREDAFYTKHKDEFHEKYHDKWLVITGESLFGVYDTIAEAVETALPRFKPGEFMIRRPADDGRVIEIGPIIRTRYPGDEKKPKPKPKIISSGRKHLKVPYAW